MGALADHEGALRASLQTHYGLRLLSDGRTEPERDLMELADYVAHLPPGCALWRETGGVLALSEESLFASEVVHRLDWLLWHKGEGKGPKPERIPMPRPAAELRAEAREKSKSTASKAQRHAERVRRRSRT